MSLRRLENEMLKKQFFFTYFFKWTMMDIKFLCYLDPIEYT